MDHSPNKKIWAGALSALLALFAAVVVATPAYAADATWKDINDATNLSVSAGSGGNIGPGTDAPIQGVTVSNTAASNLVTITIAKNAASTIGISGTVDTSDTSAGSCKGVALVFSTDYTGTVTLNDVTSSEDYPLAIDVTGLGTSPNKQVFNLTLAGENTIVTPPNGLFVNSAATLAGAPVQSLSSSKATITVTGTATIQNSDNSIGAVITDIPSQVDANTMGAHVLTGSGTLNIENAGGASSMGNNDAIYAELTNGSLTVNGGLTLNVTGGAVGSGASGSGIDVGKGVNTNALTIDGATVNAVGGGVAGDVKVASNGGHGIFLRQASPLTVAAGATLKATGGNATATTSGTYGGDGIAVDAAAGAIVTINGTVEATGGSGNEYPGYGIALNGQTGVVSPATSQLQITNSAASVTANGGAGVSRGTRNSGSTGCAINVTGNSHIYIEAGSLTANGANATATTYVASPSSSDNQDWLGSRGINLADTSYVTVAGGSLTANGGDGVRSGSNDFACYGLALTDGRSGQSLVMGNYMGEAGTGPTVTITGGNYTNPANGAVACEATNIDPDEILLYDGVNTKPNGTGSWKMYPWVCITWLNGEPAESVMGFAGMNGGEMVDVAGTSNGWDTDTVGTTTVYTNQVVIEPAAMTSLITAYEGYATNGTVVNPNGAAYAAEFEGIEDELGLPENSVQLPSGATVTVEPEANGTVKAGVVTITADATGNTTTVSASAPKTITDLYPTLTDTTGEIPMTYAVTLDGNGGAFDLYSGNSATGSLRPTTYAQATLYTQPGTGRLLPYDISNVNQTVTTTTGGTPTTTTVPSMKTWAATHSLTGGPSMEVLDEVLGALPEATTTSTTATYFQGWFNEEEGGTSVNQPFSETQTIYAHFAATAPAPDAGNAIAVKVFYNPFTGEHLFTTSQAEEDAVLAAGWADYGTAWNAPIEGVPVYRMFNPYSQDHYYTTKVSEANELAGIGWRKDFVVDGAQQPCFFGAQNSPYPVYQLFNRFVTVGTHYWTTDPYEVTVLHDEGWTPEGAKWFAQSL